MRWSGGPKDLKDKTPAMRVHRGGFLRMARRGYFDALTM